ncbi:site-2 protease family protein [Brevibacillus massiliensis]|uniref:site-2 protease family protein n=1 Tax=Brevibacillus massiliensis TaxID=1118054 RepID=UPI0002E1600D|nr:site-2 protease family protein [Brevibacillus massiliensis]
MAKTKTRAGSVLFVVGAFLLSKLKWIIPFLKLSKFGGTLISMAISLGAYALAFGWKFAAALVYLIFVHEMGHVIAAKQKGIRTSPAIFLPFVGALISLKEQPRDAKTEAYLAYGGPLAGLIAFLPAVPLYAWTHNPFWGLVIFLGAMLNLFNLLPVSPLDGGRIVSVLSTKIWFFGLAGIGLLLIFSPDPILFLIFLFGLFTWWRRIREGYQHRVLSYEKMKLTEFLDEVQQWPSLPSMAERRAALYEKILAYSQSEPQKAGFAIPFLQDDKRFARDKDRLDREYATAEWELLQQWERTPVEFEDGDPDRPVPSTLLTKASLEAAERLKKIEEEIHRLNTYYTAPASTKWKVLAAYLALALVLSLFMLYGNHIVEYHRNFL